MFECTNQRRQRSVRVAASCLFSLHCRAAQEHESLHTHVSNRRNICTQAGGHLSLFCPCAVWYLYACSAKPKANSSSSLPALPRRVQRGGRRGVKRCSIFFPDTVSCYGSEIVTMISRTRFRCGGSEFVSAHDFVQKSTISPRSSFSEGAMHSDMQALQHAHAT